MKAIVCEGFGEPSVMKVGEVHLPVHLNENEVLIKVECSACNRADTMQVLKHQYTYTSNH